MSVVVTAEFGLILRRSALHERGISIEGVLDALETTMPLDTDEELISFGPSFGQEALDVLIKRLMELGLVYFDDFIEFVGVFPSWCQFQASLVRREKQPGTD